MNAIRRRFKGFMQTHIHGMITCTEFDEFVLDYLGGELTERQRALFERHIRWCRECRQYLQGYQHAMRFGRAALPRSDDAVPEDVPEDLINAILKARDG